MKQRVTSADHNWYSKLHPTGKDDTLSAEPSQRKNILNLSLFFRIWLAVGIIISVSGLVIFTQLFNYVRPVTQQVIEDTLVDTSKLLSVSLQAPVLTGQILHPEYQAMLDAAFAEPSLPVKKTRYKTQSELNALDTWFHHKTHSSFRVYVTDHNGRVIYDSVQGSNNAEGQDYSKWNDVYLTLAGNYGARTTRRDKQDQSTSVMYVAQPIYSSNDGNRSIIGVVSVGKPTATILPYLNATRQRMLSTSVFIGMVTLLMAGLVAWWLKQSMQLVTRYTQSLAQDTKKPYFYLGSELNELTDTIEDMKHRLENKAYVSDYVHTLTHELKSPLTAIRASGELLEASDLEDEDRLLLSQNITEQSIKLQSLIDRLLLLAKIEQPTLKLARQAIDPDALLRRIIDNNAVQSQRQHIPIVYHNLINPPLKENENPAINIKHASLTLLADEFWLTQALQNVIDNALYFAHSQVIITLANGTLENGKKGIVIAVFNDGAAIPDYALDKVFNRYFSLSHQVHRQSDTSINDKGSRARKGTGLGLTLVKQVIDRHDGQVHIQNINRSAETSQPKPLSTVHPDVYEGANALNTEALGTGVLTTIKLPMTPRKVT